MRTKNDALFKKTHPQCLRDELDLKQNKAGQNSAGINKELFIHQDIQNDTPRHTPLESIHDDYPYQPLLKSYDAGF